MTPPPPPRIPYWGTVLLDVLTIATALLSWFAPELALALLALFGSVVLLAFQWRDVARWWGGAGGPPVNPFPLITAEAAALEVIRDRRDHPAAAVDGAWERLEAAGLRTVVAGATRGGDAATRDDAAQDARLRALTSLDRFDPMRTGGASAIGLPVVAAFRGAANAYDRAGRHRARFVPMPRVRAGTGADTAAAEFDNEWRSEGAAFDPPAPDDRGGSRAEAAELVAALLPLLARTLSPLELDTFVRHGRGESYAELAAATGRSPKQIENALGRARAKLARLVADAGVAADAPPADRAAELLERVKGRAAPERN